MTSCVSLRIGGSPPGNRRARRRIFAKPERVQELVNEAPEWAHGGGSHSTAGSSQSGAGTAGSCFIEGELPSAVKVSTRCRSIRASAWAAGKPTLLFQRGYVAAHIQTVAMATYDVSPDGKRFLVIKPSEEELLPRSLNVVLNWTDELVRRVPSGK